MDITKLYQTQISLTEWLEKIGHEKARAFREEDNEKRERMKVLNEVIGLPFDRPVQFSAMDIASQSALFQEFFAARGDELCALRLIPLDPSLPKLRMRGHTVKEAVAWFHAQQIEPVNYRADFVSHKTTLWSTIFVVNAYGICGEIIRGGHYQLTQGFYAEQVPLTFSFDWREWTLSGDDQEAQQHLLAIMKHLLVEERHIQDVLQQKLGALFSNNYLQGYFETVTVEESGIWFLDYNRLLGSLYSEFQILHHHVDVGVKATLKGHIGHGGVVQGRVRIVPEARVQEGIFKENEVLVCTMTTPEYITLITQAIAVVTDLGGVLTHAAIICRELKKPCIVGTQNATSILQQGDLVEVDADHGIVNVLSRNAVLA
ncbi:MAG: PEP-utilizing enzyme [Patescibacteria group bacterium]